MEIQRVEKMMNKIRKKYEEYKHFYYGYVYFWIKYFSFKKVFNLLYNLYEFKTRRVYLNSIPSIVHVDIANICVLHCPLCSTGKGDKSQTKAVMKFEEFKRIFDSVKDYTFFIWLYNWGEPFLCKDIFKIVDYCHKNNVGVKIDSNLNYYDDKILENIVKYKIDYISFSIDGLSQEVYRFYRRGGDIKKVLSGLEMIKMFKKRFKSNLPITVWQYLLNNKNVFEVGNARITAQKLGIDIFELHPLRLFTEVDSKYSKSGYNKYLSKTGVTIDQAREKTSSDICRYLWCSLVFNPDNSFSPCPVIYKDKDIFGKLDNKDDRSVKEIYNSEIFRESRKLFTTKNYKEKCFTPCSRCNWFTKPHC